MRRIGVSGYTKGDGTQVRAHTRKITGFVPGTALAAAAVALLIGATTTTTPTGPDEAPVRPATGQQGVVFRPGHLPVPGPAITVRIGPQHP